MKTLFILSLIFLGVSARADVDPITAESSCFFRLVGSKFFAPSWEHHSGSFSARFTSGPTTNLTYPTAEVFLEFKNGELVIDVDEESNTFKRMAQWIGRADTLLAEYKKSFGVHESILDSLDAYLRKEDVKKIKAAEKEIQETLGECCRSEWREISEAAEAMHRKIFHWAPKRRR